MNRLAFVLFLAGALACGSVDDEQGCNVSTDCPVGEYCARSGGERRCWPDALAPSAAVVSASCTPAPCLRDGVLHVVATVTDESEVLGASVSLDLAPAQSFPMSRSGAQWVADVPLRALPFEAFSRDVVPTVVGRDGARNESAAASGAAVGVTRLRWTYDAGAPLTAPAVMPDGTVIVGVSATADQVLAVDASGTKAWSRTVGGTSFVTAAPAIGGHAIWVGSEDFAIHAVELDGSGIIAGAGVNAGGAVKGCVGVRLDATKDWAFGASAAGFVGAASNASSEYAVEGPTSAFSAGPVVGLDGRAYAATSASSATLRAYVLTTSPAITLAEAWNASVGVNVSAPLAVDASGAIWTGTLDAKLSKTIPGETSGTVSQIATLPGSIVDSPVILANGDVVVGDQTGVIHRYSAAGTPLWTSEPNLGAAVHAPLVLAGGSAMLLAPTAGGKLFALRSDGSEVWSAALESGKAIRPGNIHTPPGQTAPVSSTAYFASESGKLFAVIVDGQLDASAPWPKAFHDPRNTNHAGPQP